MLDCSVNVGTPSAMAPEPLTEKPLQFGENNRLFGILSLPRAAIASTHPPTVFVFLNAGILHRVGPLRMYVRMARQLADCGFAALRVDLSGIGDSPARRGLDYRQSVASDFDAIETLLQEHFGPTKIIVIGLCSAADNAIKLVPEYASIQGMVLLDPFCFSEPGFKWRAAKDWVAEKLFHPIHSLLVLQRQAKKFLNGKRYVNRLSLRDLPDLDQMQEAFRCVRGRKGHVLSIFSHYATVYYNRPGQLERVLSVEDYDKFATEVFWPDVEHTYMLEVHRLRLLETICSWAVAHLAENKKISRSTTPLPRS